VLDFIESIKDSSLTLIGYFLSSEDKIDNFVKNFLQPDIIIFENSEHEILKKLEQTRDKKIYIEIPFNNVSSSKAVLNQSRSISKFIERIIIIASQNNNRIIIKNEQYDTFQGVDYSMVGGSLLLYKSSVVLIQEGGKLKCIKNRYGSNFTLDLTKLIKSTRRLKISKINEKTN
jgi:hypothetical protein